MKSQGINETILYFAVYPVIKENSSLIKNYFFALPPNSHFQKPIEIQLAQERLLKKLREKF